MSAIEVQLQAAGINPRTTSCISSMACGCNDCSHRPRYKHRPRLVHRDRQISTDAHIHLHCLKGCRIKQNSGCKPETDTQGLSSGQLCSRARSSDEKGATPGL